jgi:hypothetical protein
MGSTKIVNGLLAIAFVLAPSCSKMGATEESLRARVQSYWEEMIKGNYREAHEYLDPRNRVSVDKFSDGASKFRFNGYRIVEVKVDQTDGNATLSLTFQPRGVPFQIPELTRPEKELWAFYKGQWYYREARYNVANDGDKQTK